MGRMRDGCERQKGVSTRTAAFARALRDDLSWLAPCAAAMGLCQSLMYIPFMLGPVGRGLGASAWWDPAPTTVFFFTLAATMLADGFAARRGATRVVGACAFGAPQAWVFTAGQALMVLQGLAAEDSVWRLALCCAGAAPCGFATACAQLSSARLLARLKPGKSFEVVFLAQAVTAAVLLYALLGTTVWFGLPLVALPLVTLRLARVSERRLPFGALSMDSGEAEQLGMGSASLGIRAGIVTGCTVALASLAVFVARSWFDVVTGVSTGTLDADLAVTAEGTGKAIALFDGLEPGLGVICLIVVFAAVFVVTGLLGLAARTLSLTLVLRIAIPPAVLATLLVSLCGGPSGEGLTFCALTIVLGTFALAVVDQAVWLLTAGFMRANGSTSESTVTTMRTCEFVGATLGAAFVPPLAHVWGIMPTLFMATGTLLAVFVTCVPTFEPHLVSPWRTAPPGLRGLGADEAGRYALLVSRFDLTAREAEVLALLAQGADAAAVAKHLVVSLSTANTHIRHIYAKMGIHSRQELLAEIARGKGTAAN